MAKKCVIVFLVVGLVCVLGSLGATAQCNPQPWCEYMSCLSDGGVCNYDFFVTCSIFTGGEGIARPILWTYYCPPPQGPGLIIEYYGEICTPCVPL